MTNLKKITSSNSFILGFWAHVGSFIITICQSITNVLVTYTVGRGPGGILERGAILEIKLERGALKAKKGVGARSDFRISWSAERRRQNCGSEPGAPRSKRAGAQSAS